jgi:hypothetical protein
LNSDVEGIVREHGPWTAMAIKLADGSYTREPVPDYRLRRLVQVAQDMVGKPLAECRVLDLACLEGQYAIEFALHGAETWASRGAPQASRSASSPVATSASSAPVLSRTMFVTSAVTGTASSTSSSAPACSITCRRATPRRWSQ